MGLRQDGRSVAFVCRSGMRSAMASRTARAAGLVAHNVRGGMLAWDREEPQRPGRARGGRGRVL